MAKRRTPRTHYLIAGDSIDLPLLEDMVSRLPINAYGQVFVEIEDENQVQQWALPENITVTWLVRDEEDVMTPSGELLAGAVTAWAGEWMPDDETAHESPFDLWIGCLTSERVGALSRELAHRLEALSAHGHEY